MDESWIAQPLYLIRRMPDWVNVHYPGTKLALTEYNWGAPDHINGALAQADVLGIFGREGLDLATLWDPPSSTAPLAFAFRMCRNYDQLGGTFGDDSVQATSANQECVSIYAALRSDRTPTVILINKTAGLATSRLTVASKTAIGNAKVCRYGGANLSEIVHQPDLPVGNGGFDVALPANSIALLAIPRARIQADFDIDGDVDAADFAAFEPCLSGAGTPHDGSRACTLSDLDGDNDVDQSDFGIFQRCLSGAAIPADPACAAPGSP